MYLKLKNVGVLSAEKHRHTLSDVLMENIILQFVLSLGGADFFISIIIYNSNYYYKMYCCYYSFIFFYMFCLQKSQPVK